MDSRIDGEVYRGGFVITGTTENFTNLWPMLNKTLALMIRVWYLNTADVGARRLAKAKLV